MLHEEVAVDWNSLQRQVQDVRLLETLQVDFAPGVLNRFLMFFLLVIFVLFRGCLST